MSKTRYAQALLLPLLLGALSAAPAAAQPTGVTRVTNSVDIACTGSVLHQAADWYFPAGTPRGLVLLVHGFGANKDLYRDLADRLTAAGAVVFAPDLPAMDPRGCALSSLLPNRA